MADYTTQFGGYTLDARPNDWTLMGFKSWNAATLGDFRVEADAGAFSGKELEIPNDGAGAQGFIRPNALATDIADVEVLAFFNMGSSTITLRGGPVVRGAENGNAFNGYQAHVEYRNNLSVNCTLNRYAGTSRFLLGSFAIGTASIGTGLWVRLRAEGDQIKAKFWRQSDAQEPSAWGVEATDANLASGAVGLASGDNSTNGPTIWCWQYDVTRLNVPAVAVKRSGHAGAAVAMGMGL